MKKEYTIYINRRKIPATYRMFLCHNTMQFSGIQSQDVYSVFLRDYIFPNIDMYPYMTTIASYLPNTTIRNNIKDCIEVSGLRYKLRRSVLLSAWYATYFPRHDSSRKGVISINELIDTGINYSRLNLGKEYLSLYPLTKFYKQLTLDVDLDRYGSPVYEKDYVTVEDINKALENKDFSFEDIKEDIEHHCVLCPYKDYYIWGSNIVYNWFLEIDHSELFRININKILSVEHNYLF